MILVLVIPNIGKLDCICERLYKGIGTKCANTLRQNYTIILVSVSSEKISPNEIIFVDMGALAAIMGEQKQGRKFMAKKKFFLLLDTETTQSNKVADFAALVVDKQGVIHHQIAVLVRDFYLDRDQHPLFFTKDADPLWGAANLPKRYAEYDAMIADGRRMLASVPAINRWLAKANAQYSPIVTAYNLAFDRDKCNKSGIDIEMFSEGFCLWHASAAKWANRKDYLRFALNLHAFNNRTKATGSMTMKTNAEIMAAYILGDPEMPNEPHTALEDARDYELPILKRLLATSTPKEYMEAKAYTYQDFQLRDLFQPR